MHYICDIKIIVKQNRRDQDNRIYNYSSTALKEIDGGLFDISGNEYCFSLNNTKTFTFCSKCVAILLLLMSKVIYTIFNKYHSSFHDELIKQFFLLINENLTTPHMFNVVLPFKFGTTRVLRNKFHNFLPWMIYLQNVYDTVQGSEGKFS